MKQLLSLVDRCAGLFEFFWKLRRSEDLKTSNLQIFRASRKKSNHHPSTKPMKQLLLLLLLLSACATVRPWERERLAHPAMADDPDPEGERFEGHVRGAREAALDPGASGGGGCGCN